MDFIGSFLLGILGLFLLFVLIVVGFVVALRIIIWIVMLKVAKKANEIKAEVVRKAKEDFVNRGGVDYVAEKGAEGVQKFYKNLKKGGLKEDVVVEIREEKKDG